MALHKIYGDVAISEDLNVDTLEGETPYPIYLNPASLVGKPAGLVVRT
jgi:hypothetical protein